MSENEALPPDQQRTIDRIAALLMTVPGWQCNYTASLDAAKWMAGEAQRIGWNLQASDKGPADHA